MNFRIFIFMFDYKKQLNQEQLDVVLKGDGSCLVLAGAGSGKTRTLIYRVAYLLEKGILPQNILLMTFTNKAANEMIERVEQLLGFKPEGLVAGTFHKIGNKILREHCNKLGFQKNFLILDEEDSISVLKSCFKDLGIDTKGENFLKIEVVRSYLSFYVNSQRDLAELLQNKYDLPDYLIENIIRVADSYKLKKKLLNSMDFDYLLLLLLSLLENFPEVCDALSSQFKYVLIDEYQDTNSLQAKIIKLLAHKHKNILVVGDDSQSIYSFRAAEIKNILNFEKEFPNTKIFRLETNYRSTPQILSLANCSILKNQNQYPKELKAVIPSGSLPLLIPCRDAKQQASLIAKRILELVNKRVLKSEIAVLFRSGYLSADLQLELSRLQIPYIVRGGQRYFEQAHIKDVLSYLKVILNISDEISWKRMLIKLPGVGQVLVDRIWKEINGFESIHELLDSSLHLPKKADYSWQRMIDVFKFILTIDFNRQGFISEIIKFVLDSGYKDYLKKNFEDAEDRVEDLLQFINFVYAYKNIEELLSDVSLSENFRGDKNNEENFIVLSTIHQAKGLEWENVFLIGLKDGGFPHPKSMNSLSALEEERRLFYVAVTRAKKQLYLLYPLISRNYEYGEFISDPSIFIQELEDDKYFKIDAMAAPEKKYFAEKEFEEDFVEYD